MKPKRVFELHATMQEGVLPSSSQGRRLQGLPQTGLIPPVISPCEIVMSERTHSYKNNAESQGLRRWLK